MSKYLLSIVVLLIAFPACERDTKLTLEGRNPPTFEMTGSGELAMLRMHGPKVRDVAGEAAFIIWEIGPKDGRFNGRRVEDLGSIKYGEIPDGYVQRYPEQGVAPPLVEGESYDVFVDTVNANGATAYFKIRNGKVIEKDFRGVEINH
jgi:hypothetical protein